MFLMALFALVIVPKELWHNCDDHVHYHHHSEDSLAHGTFEDGAHCAICDFQILPFAHSLQGFDFVAGEGFIETSTQLASPPAKGSQFTLPGRGPPTFKV